MTRKEAYNIIKEKGYGKEIAKRYGHHYTNISTEVLIHEIEQLGKKCTKPEKAEDKKECEKHDYTKEIKKIKLCIISLVSALQVNGDLDSNEVENILSKLN